MSKSKQPEEIHKIFSVIKKSPGYALVELEINLTSSKIISSKQISEPDLLQITIAKLQQQIKLSE